MELPQVTCDINVTQNIKNVTDLQQNNEKKMKKKKNQRIYTYGHPFRKI